MKECRALIRKSFLYSNATIGAFILIHKIDGVLLSLLFGFISIASIVIDFDRWIK